MKIIVNSEEVTNFRTRMMLEMEKIEKNIQKMEALENELIWEGEAHDKFINKYNGNIKKLKEKMTNLMKCVKILDNFNNNYGKAQNEVRTNCKAVKAKEEARYEQKWS